MVQLKDEMLPIVELEEVDDDDDEDEELLSGCWPEPGEEHDSGVGTTDDMDRCSSNDDLDLDEDEEEEDPLVVDVELIEPPETFLDNAVSDSCSDSGRSSELHQSSDSDSGEEFPNQKQSLPSVPKQVLVIHCHFYFVIMRLFIEIFNFLIYYFLIYCYYFLLFSIINCHFLIIIIVFLIYYY